LFSSRDETSALKIIDFGLSDFVRPGMLNWSCGLVMGSFSDLTLFALINLNLTVHAVNIKLIKLTKCKINSGSLIVLVYNCTHY
jgi:hypothetical protein